MLGLGTIFYTTLLFINAIAILNEERFLSKGSFVFLTKVGWSTNSRANGFDDPSNDASVKQRLVHLISAVRVLLRSTCLTLLRETNYSFTVPLIAINIVVIVYEILLG